MRLLPTEEDGVRELRSHTDRTPAGSCLWTLSVRGRDGVAGLRILCRRPGQDGPTLAHEVDVPHGAIRLQHLVAIPRDATALYLRGAGTGVAEVARVTVVELSTPALTAILAARWLGRQLRHPRLLGPKVANLVRVLRRTGVRGALQGLVASQTARQSGAAAVAEVARWRTHRREPAVPHGETKEGFDRFHRRRLDAFLRSRDSLDLPAAREPHVSVVVVAYNRAELLLECLRRVAEHARVPAEVVVVDNASTDRTDALLDRLRGATVVRNIRNVGFVDGCNQGVERARGRVVLLLNSDAFLLPDSLEAALATLESDPAVGVVGGPLLSLDGRLQEAGSIVWPDGRAQGYGRGDDPDEPQYRFRRDVDFVSGAFLLTGRELWEKLGGFDRAYAPAYYEDADYCLRVRDSGFRVVYEPRAPVAHYEYASSAGPREAAAAMASRREVFLSRHGPALASRPPEATLLLARSADRRPRVLIVDDWVPLAVMGSGSPRMAAIVRGLVGLGYQVTFFPGLPFAGTWEDVYAEVPPEVEVMVGWDRTRLGRFLEERAGHYQHVIVSRSHNMAIVHDLLRRHPGLLEGATLVYDAEAIGAMRAVHQAATGAGDPDQARRLVQAEVTAGAVADRVASVSEGEAGAFRAAGIRRVHLLPHAVDLRPTATPFADRSTFLFVGRLSEDLSPNVDGLGWFIDAVWPRIRRQLSDQGPPELVVAGRTSPTVPWGRAPGVRLLGAVPDLTHLYERARVFVAPLRFSAGIPLKILEAASFGVPVVTTELLRSQLGWDHDVELLAAPTADPEAFARHCVSAYLDGTRWAAMREGALRRLAATATRERFEEQLRDLLAPHEEPR